jgi:Icc protein
MGERDTKPLRLVQVTDTHLFADPDERLLGVSTERTLAGVLEQIRSDGARPDAVLATGDLSQDGSPEAYRRGGAELGSLGAPVYWLPGNHDRPGVMKEHFVGGRIRAERGFRARGWQIVLLNSVVVGEVGGHLGDDELERLEGSLRAHPAQHALVCLHHHPVAMDTVWLDGVGLGNADAFFGVLDRYPQVRGVLWGHVHQAYDRVRRGVRLMATPSTCFQFLRGSREFALDASPPAYRWLELAADGGISTQVRRAAGVDASFDVGASGY